MQNLLQQYWNYSSFRPLQEEIITAVLQDRDTLALLPTGGGKSVCYQLPALAREGFCLVVSPLISLMQDQVMQLLRRDIPAAYIHSGMTSRQVADILHKAAENELKLLYVAPERLLSTSFQDYMPDFQLNLIAVDEAHCISQWGHDFRPAYRQIGDLRSFFPGVPVLALTASANAKVQDDIVTQLKMKQPAIFRQSVVRDNLFYHIHYTENKPQSTISLFKAVSGSGIIYCRSRKRCVERAMQLRDEKLKTGIYHAGMPKEERDAAQKRWTESSDEVMCATTAFGMGIDKPNVKVVEHYDVPESIEAYYQEAGRAGRNGKKAHAVLLYNQADLLRLQESVELHYPPESYLKKVYQWVGDYLQMPVGSGRETLHSFDALLFIHNFKLEILKTLSAIRLLCREGLWIWNENAATNTTVQFTTNRATLNYLEQNEPPLYYIASSLLRLYGSIFYYPTVIKEFEVSRILRIEKPQLDKGLKRLSALGVIDYQPAESGGTLYWLDDRVADRNLILNTDRINRLREAHRDRVEQMIVYITEENTCRNILLAQYFGEQNSRECGSCDSCKRKKQKETGKELRKEQVLELIREKQSLTLSELYEYFPQAEKSTLIDYIRSLSDERLCRIYPGEVIFAT